ncbi:MULTISPECIES: TetR/AcrR family transcriptional regulator [Azospirillum]|uniref:Helix-turn-helix domain-containing protein n=1 Tax=Azospirillum brasilense TaxID=192 RepID=A0ABU4P4A9_AZOBR|nr:MULTISPECIES: TetR/AcrR family transcriptional regulator [Azospirillum]ALJ36808.1 TetR family transcriptional regulator [Azospirillum brasilense]MDW7555893.1 helix-turn-helix domain-containing protein [Azospirillum brasilense]MDW7595970.1 helix-turn-helix domain-containing protein [Azospirillum brasilense]MDW7630975.1 helix-turn-helix domain-containing protein [Azospirillum brasilense]MDX5951581.1 helix-turn-helix domain-containing protein [Azospirillum brasilense]
MTATKKSEPRGRRRSFDVDEAVETAMRLFHARGYDAVGVAELGAELGIKPPSFYAAFGSKAGLFERALRRYAAGEANIFARALAEGGDVATVIGRTLALAAELYPGQGGTAGCLVLDGARNSADPEAQALADAAKREGCAAVRDFIATEAPDRADALADLVVVAMLGMSAAARDGADRERLERVAAMMDRAFRRELAGA